MTSGLPINTRFPYTTLFRSVVQGGLSGVHSDRQHGFPPEQPFQVSHRFVGAFGLCQLFLGRGIDRKSTRLNSSHAESSYAVVCLKIKTTRYNIGFALKS